MQRAFWQREQAWRCLGGVHDGVLDRLTVFRAVPLNQPWMLDILFGDVSCRSTICQFRPWFIQSLRNRCGHVRRLAMMDAAWVTPSDVLHILHVLT